MAVSPQAARVYQYLVSHGLNPYAAAGLTGNLIAESGLRTGALNPRDPGGSYGIAQWNRDRRAALNAWKDPNAKDELDRQLSFLMHELQTREKAAYQRLLKAADITGGTAGGISFERPQGWKPGNPAGGHNWGGRLSLAQQVYANQTGKTPVVAAGPSGPTVDTSQPTASGTTIAQQGPPPPPSPERALAEGVAGLLGGTLEDSSSVAPPQGAPAAAPAPQPAAPQGPEQGSASALMASIIDRRRNDRGDTPLSLLDSYGFS